jgi:hypothetical protein
MAIDLRTRNLVRRVHRHVGEHPRTFRHHGQGAHRRRAYEPWRSELSRGDKVRAVTGAPFSHSPRICADERRRVTVPGTSVGVRPLARGSTSRSWISYGMASPRRRGRVLQYGVRARSPCDFTARRIQLSAWRVTKIECSIRAMISRWRPGMLLGQTGFSRGPTSAITIEVLRSHILGRAHRNG